MNKSSLEAAAEAAAKVNAMLIAKGKLRPPSMVKPKLSGNSLRNLGEDLITAEVAINDAPQMARNMLTRGHSQDEICKFSGASISTRGRYMTLEERQNISTPDCRPLYLHVQASTHESVSLAVAKIQEIINQHVIASGGVKCPTAGVVTYPAKNINGTIKTTTTATSSQPVPSGPHFVQDKVFVGLEHSPPTYPVREKILGPGGIFLQHIRVETGANVTLRGRGSGFIEPTSGREAFEPLYIHITHPKVKGLQAAKALAINLVETAHVEFFQWQKQQRAVMQPITSVVMPNVAPLQYHNQGISSQAVIAYPATYVTNHTSDISRTSPAVSSVVGVIPLPVSAAYTIASTGQNFLSTQPGTSQMAQYQPPVQTVSLTQPLVYSGIPTSLAHISQTVLQESPAVVTPSTASYPAVPEEYVSNNSTISSDNHSLETTSVLPISIVQRFEPVYPLKEYATAGTTECEDSRQHNVSQDVKESNLSLSGLSLQKSTNSNHPTENGALQIHPATVVPSCISSGLDRHLMPPPPKPCFKTVPPVKRALQKDSSQESETHDPEAKKLRGALIGIASVYGSDDSSDEESTNAGESSQSKSYTSF